MYIGNLKREDVQKYSYISVFVQQLFKKEDGDFLILGNGTGFFITIKGINYFVTNWHVMTGRDPSCPSKTLPNYPISPSHINIFFPRSDNKKHIVPFGPIPLYQENDQPIWIECNDGYRVADLAAIPLEIPEQYLVTSINDKNIVDIHITPGMDLCIIGFPFGMDETNPFPIWKRAMVASEPRFLNKGKAVSYVDTPGRPGMSGSPVYALVGAVVRYKSKVNPTDSPVEWLKKIEFVDYDDDPFSNTQKMAFIGVYAGSMGDESLEKMQLGRFIPVEFVFDIARRPRPGENPHPPSLD